MAKPTVAMREAFEKTKVAWNRGNPKPLLALADSIMRDFYDSKAKRWRPPTWLKTLSAQKQKKVSHFLLAAQILPGLLRSKTKERSREMWRVAVERNMAALEAGAPIFAAAERLSAKPIHHETFKVIADPKIPKKTVNAIIAELTVAKRRLQKRFPEVLYGTVYFTADRQKKRSAFYHFHSDTIYINALQNPRFTRAESFAHELGHRFEHWFAPPEMQSRIDNMSYDRKVFVSDYAKRKPGELFADSFSFYNFDKHLPPVIRSEFADVEGRKLKMRKTSNLYRVGSFGARKTARKRARR
jgi:hypothetical protein